MRVVVRRDGLLDAPVINVLCGVSNVTRATEIGADEERLRPCVSAKYCQPFGQMARDLRLQRVVVRCAEVREHLADVGVLREWTQRLRDCSVEARERDGHKPRIG